MGRKENEKVGFFNCHGMGGNQVRKLWSQITFIYIVLFTTQIVSKQLYKD